MSAARLRPELRLPWYASFAILAVSYVAWAALRGWDFRPNAFWLLLTIVLGALYGSRAWLVKEIAKDEADEATEAAVGAPASEPGDAPAGEGAGSRDDGRPN